MSEHAFEILATEVEWRYGPDWRWERPAGHGRVVAYCDAPQVLIETPDGRKVWWREDLTRPVPQQPMSEESGE